MKRILLLVAALMALAVPAGATVLDFEGLTTESAAPLPTSYGGLTWDSGWYLYNQNAYSGNPTHSGNYGIVNNYGINPLGVQITAPTPFDFNGAWVSGWYFGSPSQIKAQGFDAANNLIGETPWISLTPGVSEYLSANFNDVTRVNFVGGQFFTLDDFTFNGAGSAPVPEPSSVLLFGAGLAGLGFLKRRKKA